MVGSSELTIRTILLPTISVELYRKGMIAILFFLRILSLSSSPSVSVSDLTTVVASYFVLPTGSADSMRHAFSTLRIFKTSDSSIPRVNQR